MPRHRTNSKLFVLPFHIKLSLSSHLLCSSLVFSTRQLPCSSLSLFLAGEKGVQVLIVPELAGFVPSSLDKVYNLMAAWTLAITYMMMYSSLSHKGSRILKKRVEILLC